MNIDQKLKEPFALKQIHWVNKGKGELAHLTARDVMARLDDVVGVSGWQDKITYVGNTAVCELSVKINDNWVTKSDASGESNFEAEKGASSTAFKRAASKFGIGRYLYYLPSDATRERMPKWATPEGYRELIGGDDE